MKIVKPTKAGISQAIKILRQGGVIVYPTDTAYALGGIFNLPKVTAKILKIKNRKDKKFTIIASNLNQVKNFFKLNQTQKKLAQKYWPGPLSLVVSPRFAIRVPHHKIALVLAQKTGKPLIATSANISGVKTLYRSQEIIKQFLNKAAQPDLILDFGQLPKNKTSTIVEVRGDKIKILRPGKIKIND